MTENKRFDSIYYEKFCRVITDNGKEISPLEVVDLLNEQDAEIKRLKKENQGLQFKIIDMLDKKKKKGTVTREEIKKWWNGDVE